jgi:RNA polymerase sigma-70 factor (ECF subfamily)
MADLPERDLDLDSLSALMPEARRGDRVARDEICQQVLSYLTYAAARKLDERLSAKVNPSDIVQLTLTKMIQGFENFRGSTTAEFYGWLNKILHNEVNTVRRDLQRECRDVRREQTLADQPPGTSDLPPHDQTNSPSQAVMRGERLERFHAVMEKLPPDYAEVIRLRSLLELPFQQVAERMGKTQHSVTKLWYRAIVRLQEELDGLDDSIL